MKQIYSLILLFLISFQGISQSVSITKVIETDCSSPYIKSVELYVSGTIDFSSDIVEVNWMQNGNAWSTEHANGDDVDKINALGVVTDSHIYLVRDIDLMAAEFPSVTFDATNTVVVTFGSNGDDGVQVVMNGNVVSQFGKDATDADDDNIWEHDDSVVSRKIGVADSGTWDETHWEYSGKNSLDNKGVCKGGAGFEAEFASLGNGHPLQSWTPPTASIDDFAINKLSIYPNPLTDDNRILHINANFKEDVIVKVYDISGKEILSKKIKTNTINLSTLKTGVYMINVKQKNINLSSRLIVN